MIDKEGELFGRRWSKTRWKLNFPSSGGRFSKDGLCPTLKRPFLFRPPWSSEAAMPVGICFDWEQ